LKAVDYEVQLFIVESEWEVQAAEGGESDVIWPRFVVTCHFCWV